MNGDSASEAQFAIRSSAPSTAIVEAVAETTGVDPLDCPPLWEVVDPEALDALFLEGTRGTVTFEYAGCRVAVEDGETVSVCRRADAVDHA